MEDSLKKSEFRYRQIVETAQEGMWVIDQNNKTVFVNKKMCEIVGYSKEEMKGKPNYFLKDDEEGKEAALRQIERRKRGINEIYESQFLTKSGRNIWTTVATNPIYDEDGAYKGTLAMITDITTRKEQELQIRKNAEERELLIRKLTNSIKDLQQFTYITSHNFTAPLSNLIALLSLFDYSNLNEDNREVVEMFKTSTNQLNKTINDIVQILIIKDNANVSITHNKISTLLNNVYEALAYEINETGCTISSNLEVEEILFINLTSKAFNQPDFKCN
jgi:PAS domain S-box-containing protein